MFSTIVSSEAAWATSLTQPTVFLDCRFALGEPASGRNQYHTEHIPEAVYAHLDDDLSARAIPGVTGRHPMPETSDYISFLQGAGISNDTQVFTYDDSGGPYAARAWWLLRYFGHESVAVIDGGWGAWKQAGLPVSNSQSNNRRGSFAGHEQEKMLISTADLETRLAGELEGGVLDDLVLIDARATERYLGLVEPLDPVAGHIPGAISCPFKDNLDDRGHFKSPSELSKIFSAAQSDAPVISYCGSGVTGAHNVLAMVHAGFDMPALYVGSWSAWITDPTRKIINSSFNGT